MKALLSLALLLTLVGCQDSVVGPDADVSAEAAVANVHGPDVVYEAILKPLNARANKRGVTGKAQIVVDDGLISFAVDARGVAPGITHLQHVHAADACPKMKDDANRDGLLDLIEGVPVYGGIFIQLDSDLAVQNGGDFPVATDRGILSYYQEVTAPGLVAGLKDAGVLGDGELVNLEGRHIVIHGVAPDTELPSTVASIGDIPAQVTLPVACGEIRIVSE